MSPDPDPALAIVVGGFVSGLELVRSLAKLKCRVIVITTHSYDMAQHSRYVSEHHHLDDLDQHPESLAFLLERHAGKWNGALVLPTGDAAIASLALYHERLAPWFRLAIPPLDSVPYLLDRTRMLKAAADVGIPMPKNFGSTAEMAETLSPVHYPVVVKPIRSGEFMSKFGKKLFVVRDPSSFSACARELAEAGVEGQVFDLIPGPDSAIHVVCLYMDQHGQPLAQCTIRKLRQSPPGFGIARVAEFVENIPLLSEQSIELLHRMGFRGFAAIEFKYDERDDAFHFIEVNGRSVIFNSLLRQGNLDVARMMFSDYAQGQAKPVETHHWPGVWIHLHADLLRSLQNWRREELAARDYLGPYRRQKTFAVWSSSDPKPFRAQWSRTFRQACSAAIPRFGKDDRTGI
jgi:D-aspartate ligase